MSIGAVSNVKSKQVGFDLSALLGSLEITDKAKDAVKDVSPLLFDFVSALRTEGTTSGKSSSGVNVVSGVVSLDDPDNELAKDADLERLLGLLMADNDNRQLKMSQERIDLMKGVIRRQQDERMKKLQETLKKMDKAAKTSLIKKIFSYVLVVVMVAIAVAACIATGGLALGPVLAAALSAAFLVLDETGMTEKMVEALAERLEQAGLDADKAKIVAQVLVTVGEMALMLGSGLVFGGVVFGGAAAKVASGAMKTAATVKDVLSIVSAAVGLGNVAASAVNAVANYKYEKAQAELLKTKQLLAMLQQFMDEEVDELESIVERLKDKLMAVMAMMDGTVEAQGEIARNIGESAA